MKIGLIGLGRMGQSIAHRLLQAGHEVVAFDLDEVARSAVQKMGAVVAADTADVATQARIIWLMVPAGKVVDAVLQQLESNLQEGDIIIDGGNSKFSDSMLRGTRLSEQGVFFLDCGTSGGLKGREIGFSLMVGGDKQAFEKAKPIFESVATADGFGYMGRSGAGHYVKMIHNGIEYALLQAYAEGFHLLKAGEFSDLDLEEVSRVWMHGSVIRSWILDLAHEILQKDQELKNVSGEVAHTGMGAWTVDEAHKQKIPVKLIEDALIVREQSQQTGGNYATKIVAMLRNKFGGHAVKKFK